MSKHSEAAQKDKGILHYIGVGLSAAILIAVLAIAAIVVVVPKVAGAVPLTILTSSMEPGLPPGTLIVIRPVDTSTLGVGDVATYQIRSGEPDVITHRIIGVNAASTGGMTFEFQGDNNSDPDPDPVLPEQIQGEFWYAVPFVGWANNAVNGVSGSIIIPIGAGLLFAYAAWTIGSGLVQRRREKRSVES